MITMVDHHLQAGPHTLVHLPVPAALAAAAVAGPAAPASSAHRPPTGHPRVLERTS
ncbi:hypothetical protein ACFV1N_46135 [Streptosporangium canum]|uniref:hypothetical protein n=1 Tax=Streptosporangium canum TaxID=324952 RepID=UPI00367F65C2